MPKLSKTVIIPHEAGNVFDLVADIGRYPEFIRWIRSMKVIPSDVIGPVKSYRGEADVGFKGFSERFGTDVVADEKERTIRVSLAHGPFRRLRNTWAMRPDGEGRTIVDFFIDYEFRNPVLSLLARANTELAVNKIMAAFKTEADRRYGTSSR
ncbi:type II toxin-antitoxin system RatA family toxin [Henriciella aquimarina]|uniref:type II toxin-antitoxin system RatA family toxin n=1 Tax=Henriciella aquimarina TaxID=545261 RepID=UPI001301D245|nr:SRPBCC family protein [Henriciella aquimarina]